MVPAGRSATSRQVIREGVPLDNNSENYNPEGEGSDPSMTRRPTPREGTSKQKGKQRGGRRNTGKLSKLPDMPLDILYEIFSLVYPVDLLRMSWASKAFRNVLVSKSSRQVWKAAFDNILEARRPPPCPEGLSEIAYASLLYNPCCMDCGAPRAPAYWMTLVRVCMGCIKNWVTVAGGIQDRALRILSHDKLRSSSQVLPTVYIKIPPFPTGFHVFTKDLKQLTADLEATDDKLAVVRRYGDALLAKVEFSRMLVRLEDMEKVDREAALTAARDRRTDQILQRLTDGGWGEEILSHRRDYVRSIAQVKGVRVARPLTDKVWEEMEARILEAMRECKKDIEDRVLEARSISRVNEIRVVVEKYQRTLNPHDFCPRTEDVYQIPDIRKAIIDGTDEEFDTCVEEVASGLPKLTSKFLEERTAKISALVPFNERPDNVLSLAAAWFNCGWCHQYRPMHGIDMLRHQCLIPWSPPSGKTTTFALRRGWCAESSRFTFSQIASTIARGLILDCGEDPESITLAEMNSKFHRFVFYENDELVAHNWEETFKYKSHHSSGYHRFLGPDEFPEFVHDPDAHNERLSWGCLHCWHYGEQILEPWGLVKLPIVKRHITNEHGVGAPTEGVDYFFHDRYRPPKFARAIHKPTPANPPPL